MSAAAAKLNAEVDGEESPAKKSKKGPEKKKDPKTAPKKRQKPPKKD